MVNYFILMLSAIFAVNHQREQMMLLLSRERYAFPVILWFLLNYIIEFKTVIVGGKMNAATDEFFHFYNYLVYVDKNYNFLHAHKYKLIQQSYQITKYCHALQIYYLSYIFFFESTKVGMIQYLSNCSPMEKWSTLLRGLLILNG
jgi:hypothetical protein